VLSIFENIGIGTAYRHHGRITDQLPFDFDHPDLEPVIEMSHGWNQPVSSVREMTELPVRMQAYIDRLQILLDCPVAFVSTGPERDALIEVTDFARA
jgi:adenylosuccinate synthase